MSAPISESDRKIVNEAADRLMEHFDSVRIFVTRHRGDTEESQGYTTGGGNFYAQAGQVSEWVVTQNENVRKNAREVE